MPILSKQDLADFTLRQLGAPVVNIEIDDEQLTDCLELAIEYYQTYHYDGIERDYIAYQITADDVTNKYVTLPDSVFSVIRLLPQTSVFNSSDSLFNFQYQIMQNEMTRIVGNGGVSYYYSVMSYLAHMNFVINKEHMIRFNRRMNRVYIDSGSINLGEGAWVVFEVYRALDPETYTEVYNDMWLKKYATALVKKMWGTNLKKFSGMTLPGGIQYNGQTVFDEAVQEIEKLELEATNNSAPLSIFVG